jgi:DNA-binding XRE family transcriptional regulator
MLAPVPEHRTRMHELRQEMCMTLDEVADAAGIARNTMRRIEAGHSGRIGTRRALSEFFNAWLSREGRDRVSIRDLFPELFDRAPAPS